MSQWWSHYSGYLLFSVSSSNIYIFLEGRVIRVGSRHRVAKPGHLLIQDVRREDQGVYRCVVQGTQGEVFTRDVYVHVVGECRSWTTRKCSFYSLRSTNVIWFTKIPSLFVSINSNQNNPINFRFQLSFSCDSSSHNLTFEAASHKPSISCSFSRDYIIIDVSWDTPHFIVCRRSEIVF